MRRAVPTLSLAAVLLSVVAAPLSAGESPVPPKLRLPPGAVPTRYVAELWIDPSKEKFEGKIEIQISSKEETGTIWLNAKELEVETASAHRFEGSETIPATAAAAGSDFVRLTFRRNLSSGPWVLSLEYKGRLDLKDTEGLFRQREGDDWYVFSQFEEIDARRAFPCFDEPGFKVPWQLALHVPKGLVAVSNTPVRSESDEAGGMKRVLFEPTKPLPSYLIALGVGPFDVVNAGTAGRNKVPMRMIVPKGRAADTRWAAESTGPILEQLESYFDIPYPYEKLDHLVIPQFDGAMENPGLVTYASNYILSKGADETILFRRKYASLCAHETAHQWFGDLVTMAWWDDVWLNEGFATWMASRVVASWKPEWNEAVGRAANRSRAMAADSLVTARRIRQPIESNDDIANAFDTITYEKGAAVIAMFEGWVGEGGFRKGIQNYLRSHAWGSATADDFVSAIAEATKTPGVVPAFRSFLDQPGVPLVTVALSCAGGAPRLLLSQKRFLPTGSTGSSQETWQVPVCARTGDPGGTTACTLLTGPSGTLALPGACPARVLANAGNGYYRVIYKGSLLGTALADGGKHLEAGERVATLSDIDALAKSGDVSTAAALAVVAPFADDPNRPVVEAVQRIAAAPSDFLVTDEMRPRYRSFVSDAFGMRAKAMGWTGKPGEGEDTQLLREVLVPFVAKEGDEPALVAEANRLAKAWLKDRNAIDPLMVSGVLGVAAWHGDMELFQAFLAGAKRASNRRERARFLDALGHFRDPSVVPVALAVTLSSDFDAREAIEILWQEAMNRETLPVAWAFLKANFDRVAERLPRESLAWFPWLTTRFCDDARRAEVEAFFRDKAARYPGGPRVLAQALEVIQLRTALKASQQESVNDYLKSYQARPTIDLKPRAGM